MLRRQPGHYHLHEGTELGPASWSHANQSPGYRSSNTAPNRKKARKRSATSPYTSPKVSTLSPLYYWSRALPEDLESGQPLHLLHGCEPSEADAGDHERTCSHRLKPCERIWNGGGHPAAMVSRSATTKARSCSAVACRVSSFTGLLARRPRLAISAACWRSGGLSSRARMPSPA